MSCNPKIKKVGTNKSTVGHIRKGFKERTKFWAASKIAMLQNVFIYYKNLEILSRLKNCGEQIKLNGEVTFSFPENIYIEDNVHIGANAYLDGRGGIFIGANTHISRNFVVHSSSHNYHGKRLPYDETYTLKSVRIERNVWIGTNVVVVPGVTIGEGAVIGAGTTVTKSVPSFAIVGNQPTRILKFRDEEHYHSLDIEKQYGGVAGLPLEKLI